MVDETRLAALGIDVSEGLAYCADDPEFYKEMLGEYVGEGKTIIADMIRFYPTQDWTNYAIRAHTAKTVSRMIGAREISERAYELEQASKAQNGLLVAQRHDRFVADYSTLIEGIEEAIA